MRALGKWIAAALLLCAGAAHPGWAQGTPPPALTAADAEAWLDGMMPGSLRAARVPGAVVVLVKDGQVLVHKGYGFADWDKHTPVDPQRTLFRPGSISKLFTWTAVMQLVEQGKLNLDADVNQYLDFQIPHRNGKALTLRNVMTHTTGLEETGRDLLTFAPVMPDLGKVLKDHIPPYLYDPGTTQGYSNYATALAGYIVERVSGQSFDDYIEQHIFTPLGMKNSTFRQPLPVAFQGQMSGGYASLDEAPKGFEIVSMAPAGSLSSTGDDMGRFMLAYLQQGRLGEAQILKPATVNQMHTQITRGMPALSGIGLGFYQQDVNGHRAIGHGGDTDFFHSNLSLFPDDGIGLYVSVNSAGQGGQGKWLRERLFEGFADRYLPDTRAPVASTVDAATVKAHGQMMAGAYRNSRREDSNFLSLLQLLSPLRIDTLADGRLSLNLGGERGTYREVAPYLWQDEHGKRRLQALVENGKVKRWGLEPYVFAFIFEPVPFMAGTGVLVLLGMALTVTLFTALLWPVAAVLRRRHGVARPAATLAWVRAASCMTLLCMALWVWTMAQMEELKDISTLLLLTQGATLIAFVGGLAAALWHARAVFRSGTTGARALAGLWVLAFLVLFVVGVYHNLLSFNPYY